MEDVEEEVDSGVFCGIRGDVRVIFGTSVVRSRCLNGCYYRKEEKYVLRVVSYLAKGIFELRGLVEKF